MSTAIPGINTGPATPPTSTDPLGSSTLGKDDFLKLLMAQLANQDPTAPQDDTAFVAQLAQFSTLEQAQGTNSRLDSLLLAEANKNQTDYVNFIGKDVTYSTNSLNHTQGLADVSQGTLGGAANKVTVDIMDSSGNVVRELNLGAQATGPMQIIWDGNNASGTPQPTGTYTVKVTATDASGAAVNCDLHATGTATGVVFNNGIPQLSVNGTQIPMANVTSISERSTQ
jgi:flagellar basal-body rod modification protein FlgD